MKFALMIIATILISMNCTSKSTTDTIRVSAIKNGVIAFSDGSTRAIPHYNDSTYTTIYLVRHCEKAKDGTNDPDLTPEGQARAAHLARVLEYAGLDQVVTTQYKRTFQTGEAVQQKTAGIPLVQVKADSLENWLTETISRHPGAQFLSVGHQNTVPQLLNKLAGKLQYQNLADNEFGRLFIAVTQGGKQTEILELQY